MTMMRNHDEFYGSKKSKQPANDLTPYNDMRFISKEWGVLERQTQQKDSIMDNE
jgi:hypothetical protein